MSKIDKKVTLSLVSAAFLFPVLRHVRDVQPETLKKKKKHLRAKSSSSFEKNSVLLAIQMFYIFQTLKNISNGLCSPTNTGFLGPMLIPISASKIYC